MKYFIIAGEASGDLHGSNLIREIRELEPEAEFRFLGGDKMSRYAGAPIVHYRDMAYMGFVNVILNLSKIFRIRKIAEREVLDYKPDKVILIDYPGFNLRFARFVKKHLPSTRVIYYISPKLWAWKTYRIHSIKKYIDDMYTIFPFETDFYSKYGYNVHYVGNPTVDSVAEFRQKEWDRNRFLKDNNLDDRPIVSLLAGSRLQEISSCLPLMSQLPERFPAYQFVVAAAPSVSESVYRKLTTDNVRIVSNSTYELLSLSSAAVVNSGTATLETALLQIPQVVVYSVKGGRFTLLLKDLLIKTKWVSLVNIIARRQVVRELLANEFTLDNMAAELSQLLFDRDRVTAIQSDYLDIIKELGTPGTAHRCAEAILKKL